MFAKPLPTFDAIRRIKPVALVTAAIGLPIFGSVSFSNCRADETRPIEQVGRWAGFGWSDGYHACASSGIRPGADLPPRSYSSTFGSNRSDCGHNKCGTTACDGGITFYDRFDAAKKIACDGPVGCDDSLDNQCDSAPYAVEVDSFAPRNYVPRNYVPRSDATKSRLVPSDQLVPPAPIAPDDSDLLPQPNSPSDLDGPSVLDQTQINFDEFFENTYSLPDPIVPKQLVVPSPLATTRPIRPLSSVPRPKPLPAVDHVVKFQAGPTPAPLSVLFPEECVAQESVATTAIRPTRMPRTTAIPDQPQMSRTIEQTDGNSFGVTIQSNPFCR